MAVLANIVRVYTATTGTGASITLGSAVPTFLTFAQGGILDGETVSYAIEDTNGREVGYGVYTSSGTTLSRDTILSSTNGGSRISLTGSAQVFITAAAEDFAILSGANTWTGVQTFSAGIILGVPLPFASGGTGLTSVSQGDVIYASAANTLAGLAKSTSATRYLSNTGSSNNPAWAQVNLANGVTGNLPVTNLNSGTSASSSTFWRGDGSWAAPTPAPGGSDTQVQYNNAGALGGSANLTWVSPALTVGAAGSTTGQLKLTGSTSGTITIQGQAAAGTYNFNLPTAAGTSGYPLLSAGGGASPMTFGQLDIASAVTGNLPVANLNSGTSASATTFWRGDGTWASPGGSGSPGGADTNVQYNDLGSFGGSANLTWVSPALTIGAAGSTTGQLKLTGATSGTIAIQGQAAAGSYNFNLPTAAGTSGYPLLSAGGGSSPMTFGQVNLAAAVTGNLPVTNLNSGTAADATTFWRGDGTWAAATSGAGGSDTQVQYNNSNALAGSANLTWVSPALTIGAAGSTTGQLKLTGSTSGTITIQGQAAAGTYNFNLPTAAGTSGYPLLSAGGGASPMTFGQLNIASAVTGNLPVANLNSGTSASSSTFWCGDGTWATPAGTGANTALSNLASVAINTTLLPGSNDGAALGSGTFAFSDLFLASGGVINWNNGNITATQAANLLTFNGGRWVFNSFSSATLPMMYLARNSVSVATPTSYASLDGGAFHVFQDSSGFQRYLDIIGCGDIGTSDGRVRIFGNSGGSAATELFRFTTASNTSSVNLNPATSDGAALGTTALQWSDLFLASGGVINWNNGNTTLTHSAGLLTSNRPMALGVAGSIVGTLAFNNATSGTITLSPTTGALGTVTITMPAATDTMAVLAASQAFTNKTYNGMTLTSTTGTFTLASGKTLTVNSTLTLAGTDSTTMTFPATSSTVLTTGNTATITKGYSVTPYNAGSSTLTPDPANGNYQYWTITGTLTLNVPGSDCAIDILATNSSATGLTISGSYTYAAASTSAYNATGTNKFIISIRRINSVSTLTITALQ